jgi:hypothetical protein
VPVTIVNVETPPVCIHFGTQHANPMRRIIISPVVCLALPYIMHFLNCGIFTKNNWTRNVLFDFCTKFAWNIPYIKVNWRYIAINSNKPLCELWGLLVRCERKLKYLDRLWETIKYKIPWQLVVCFPWCSVRKDRKNHIK